VRAWPLLTLVTLAACMGGDSSEVLSGDDLIRPLPGGDLVTNPPDDVPGGENVSFSLLLNDARADGGVVALSYSGELSSAATLHAQDMETNNYLSHTSLDGSTAGDRALAAGYDYSYISENIARGFETETGVMEGWMGSPGHRDNILDPRAEDFGLGRVDDTWVLMLGAEF
jgi:uncharacterized protein YkwD